MKRAVVVFSGGQDSTTCLVQALQQYDEVHCVTFDYGQRHRAEIDVARELALKLGARAHKVLDVTLLNELAVSSLTVTPASSKAAILSSPRPDVPLMMAPAWPMRFPGGAVRPAMNPNTGFG